MGWRAEVQFLAGQDFSLYHSVHNCSGAHPAIIQWVLEALSLEVKQPGHEAEHSVPSSIEIKNVHSICHNDKMLTSVSKGIIFFFYF
jgi:hypothetical protein